MQARGIETSTIEETAASTYSDRPQNASQPGDLPGASDSAIALVTAIRWGTATLGLLWAAALRLDPFDLVVGVALLTYALFRTFRPVEYRRRDWKSLVSILIELGIALAVVTTTDCWESPYIFSLFTPVIAAGFARGYWHAFRVAIAAAGGVALAASFTPSSNEIRPIVAWTGELLLMAAVASYGRRLLSRAEEMRALNLGQLWRLNEANSLLVSLNRLSHDLPVSFDFQDTVEGALARVREAIDPDVSALLLLDPSTGHWTVALAEGVRLPDGYTEMELPPVVREAASSVTPQLVTDLGAELYGLAPTAQSALYVPLWTGLRQVGLLAVESFEPHRFGDLEIELLRDLAEPMALTVDNARWFDRLRARGAAQERTRIARDLHDRVGQGVAYVAFELDRLSGQAKGTDLEDDLDHLRNDARSIVRELRETLYDLRTDVSSEQDIVATITEFLTRVGTRSSIHTEFTHQAITRLPIALESETWRIAQEAIVNVERHANATNIQVDWTTHDGVAVLTVHDDGVGLKTTSDAASPGRPAYGITGMRERADSIGGLLEITSGDRAGTTVRLTINTRRGFPQRATTNLDVQETNG